MLFSWNTKFQDQNHFGWYFTDHNVQFADQILSPELKGQCKIPYQKKLISGQKQLVLH